VRVHDFMPVRQEREHDAAEEGVDRIVRRIEVIRGEAEICIRFKASFDYGERAGRCEELKDGLLSHHRDTVLGLGSPGIPFRPGDGGTWETRVLLRTGDVRFLQLVASPDRNRTVAAMDEVPTDDDLQGTEACWSSWADRCSYSGPYRSQVVRSALTLKLLTYAPTGAIVAAPTTSLPENIGGERNWDYRYTWLRDSSLILYALLTVGYHSEAQDFLDWLRGVLHNNLGNPPQIMYTIDGQSEIPERELTNLDGYRHSRPVRVGNAAAKQTQLDIFGEVVMAAYVHYHRPEGQQRAPLTGSTGPDEKSWRVIRALVDDAAGSWRRPDSGIWEVRGGPQHFLYSTLMCWAALDRGIKLMDEYGLPGDRDRWESLRSEIRTVIETEGYNETIGAFTQTLGGAALDATALMIPRVGFLPATDLRVLSTIDRIQRDLTQNGLVYRYRNADGLQGGEGAFLICTFWLIDALALAGRMDEARRLYEHLLGYANDVGLFSEEIDVASGAFLGNFPQGFTHLALIRTAVDLARGEKHGPEERRVTEGERAVHAKRAASEGYG
jgi:GH15 family glucan-1,4-alpha-glucosidase